MSFLLEFDDTEPERCIGSGGSWIELRIGSE
jgi:hypothetical protein